MGSVLVVCEKPSVGASISAVLGAKERGDGFFSGNGYVVSWAVGHLLEPSPPDAYDKNYVKWSYADLPIIPQNWIYTVTIGKSKQLAILCGLMNRADIDAVVNGCDAGREGEHIFRLVYEYARCTKPMKRLWISSMEDSAVRAGFDNLKDGAGYDRLYAAALCRSKADWIVGYNATRLFSVLYNATLSVGRVQSPTLAMIAAREAEIAAFIKEPFYIVELECGGFNAVSEKYKDKAAAEAIRAKCDNKDVTVTSVERQKKSAAPPKLYDLTTLQREANRLYGFTAAQTLEYAQSLYEKKYLTYPRTDSRYLTSDMVDTAGGLAARFQSKDFFVGKEFTPNIERLINDKAVSDHHAIIPTNESVNADISAMPLGERGLFTLVVVRLLTAASSNHIYESVTVALNCAGENFTLKGKTVIEDGWKAIDNAFKASLKNKPKNEEDEEAPVPPELTEGQTIANTRAALREGFTTPPKHFTEDTLLAAMENAGADEMPDDAERKGLGTPATRAGIVEKIIKTGYVERQKKNLLATTKGVNLITVLPNELKSPLMTAEWEQKLKQVERGELNDEDFINGIISMIKSLISENSAPKPEFFGLFPDTRKQASPPMGVCPRCGAPIREYNKGFFCDTRSCGFKLWKESKFFTAKRKELNKAIAAALLKDGKVPMTGLFSEKTGKTYDAVVLLDDDGGKYVNFKLDFSKNPKGVNHGPRT